MNHYKTNYQLSKDDTLIIKGIAICFMLWHHLFYENPVIIFFVLLLVCTIISVLLEFIKNVVKLPAQAQKIVFKIDKITL